MQRGDVLIFGLKGQSAGAGGHTAIAVDHNNVIHCNYAHNGVSVNPETTMPYSMGWYVYRYKGATQQPTEQAKPSTQPGINWIKEEWRFTLSERIKLRTAPNTSATIVAELQPGDVVKYDAYCYSGGYVWIRQKRGNSYGYLATGQCVGNKRTSYWGSFN